MRERHNYSTGKHPKTCTCSVCIERRAQAMQPKVKKKRKPKSQRGKPKKEQPSVLNEVMEMLNKPQKKADEFRKDDLDA